MKRKITVIIAAIGMLAMSMYGCGAEQEVDPVGTTENNEAEEEVKIEDKGKQPSKELLEQDLSKAVTSTWEHMELTAIEVGKSMTGERDYSAEVSMIAESRYATVNLEAKISYLKYDQGWEKDEIEYVRIEGYEVNAYPTVEEMAAIVATSEEMQEYNISEQEYVDMACEGESILYTGSVDMDWNPSCHITGTVKSAWWYDVNIDSWKADVETLETDYDYDMVFNEGLYEGVSITCMENRLNIEGGGFEPFYVEFLKDVVEEDCITMIYTGSGVNYHSPGGEVSGRNEDVEVEVRWYRNNGMSVVVDWEGVACVIGYNR